MFLDSLWLVKTHCIFIACHKFVCIIRMCSWSFCTLTNWKTLLVLSAYAFQPFTEKWIMTEYARLMQSVFWLSGTPWVWSQQNEIWLWYRKCQQRHSAGECVLVRVDFTLTPSAHWRKKCSSTWTNCMTHYHSVMWLCFGWPVPVTMIKIHLAKAVNSNA